MTYLPYIWRYALKSLSLDQWKLFLQIADHASLTGTAMARDVAQSAISRQLSVIESECGGRLFERHPHGVRLNEVGQRLYPQVRDWVRRSEELMADARGALRLPSGTVRLGIIESLAGILAAPLVQAVQAEFPAIHLRITSGLSGRLTEALQQGRLDLALFSDNGRERHPQGLGMGLGSMPHWLAGPPGDPLTRGATVPFDALHQLPLVVPGRPYAFHDVLEHWARRRGILLHIALECDTLSLQKQMVAQCGLHAIMAASALSEEVQSGRLQAARIVRPTLNRRLVLRKNPSGVTSEAVKATSTLLHRLAGDLLPRLIDTLSGHLAQRAQ